MIFGQGICATGKYLNCEPQRRFVVCDGTHVPTSQTWWLSQWESVHVGRPKPPNRYRLHEIAVTAIWLTPGIYWSGGGGTAWPRR